MNDHDNDPEFEAQVRAELRRSIVPPPTPEYVRERVERTTAEGLRQAESRIALGRWHPSPALGGLAAVVAIVALAGAALIWGVVLEAPGPGATQTATPWPASLTPGSTASPGPTVSPGTLVHMSVSSDGGGFVYVEGDGLRVTTDYGTTWSEARQVPPGDSGQDHLWDVSTLDFVDSQHGWITGVTNGSEGARVTSYRTADGGRTWLAAPVVSLPADPSAARGSFVGAQDHFSDALHGWIVLVRINPNVAVKQASCQRFATADGGTTWSGPAAGSCFGLSPLVHWITVLVGYAVPDVDSSRVSVTSDGGWTWNSAVLPGVSSAQTISADSMAVDEAGHLTLVAGVGPWPAPHVVYESTDGGANWSRGFDLAMPPGFTGFSWIEIRGPRDWVASATVDAGGDRLFETLDGGRTWSAVDGEVRPSSGGALWWDTRRGMTVAWDPTCQGYCGTPPRVFVTDDGGRTWREVRF